MKTLRKGVSLTLHKKTYLCDIALTLYRSNHRPCIILLDALSPYGEELVRATANVPDELMAGLPPSRFAAKTWGENEGLWDQLEELCIQGTMTPMFQRCSTRLAISPFVHANVWDLAPELKNTFNELYEKALGERNL
jgi:hypothetical protein